MHPHWKNCNSLADLADKLAKNAQHALGPDMHEALRIDIADVLQRVVELSCTREDDSALVVPAALWGELDRAAMDWRTRAIKAETRIDPAWSQHDRIEFALRDAGFDTIEAARLTGLVEASLSAVPAAPAPVAGDAVAKLPAKWRNEVSSMEGTWDDKSNDGFRDASEHCAAELDAALAQDRASQESEQSIKADAYDMIAEAVEKSGARVTSIVDHVTGLIASQGAEPK